MIPVLKAEQIREADHFTIKNEPISSIDLMERASTAFANRLKSLFGPGFHLYVFVGTGNNGGDGLAIARILEAADYQVSIYAVGQIEKASADFLINYQRLEGRVLWINDSLHLPITQPNDIIIDAIFGSGLTRPLIGIYQELVKELNKRSGIKVSVDIASGLMADYVPNASETIFEPDYTFTFQCPKWIFLQPSSSSFVGDLHILDIGLDLSCFEKDDYESSILTLADIDFVTYSRKKYSHKGDFGRLQLIGGSLGKMGSICLSSLAALRSGVGLLFSTVPKCGIEIVQQSIPEAMVKLGEGTDFISEIELVENVNVVGIGPGLGLTKETISAFDDLLDKIQRRQQLVIDADAINILALHPDWLDRLPPETILTPHPGEFVRLVGNWSDDRDKINRLKGLCQTYKLNVVLKGAYSVICDKNGSIFYNSTGNPGMATAGSGDVLLGIISGLMATGLSPINSLKAGVYLHGMAGDIAAMRLGERSLIASDLIQSLPQAFNNINEQRKSK